MPLLLCAKMYLLSICSVSLEYVTSMAPCTSGVRNAVTRSIWGAREEYILSIPVAGVSLVHVMSKPGVMLLSGRGVPACV